MPRPEEVTPTNLRRIEFLSLTGEGYVPTGQAWVDEDSCVQGDSDEANSILDGAVGAPNVETGRTATREDGPLLLYGLCLEAMNATYWNIRVLEVAPDDKGQ